MNTIEAISNLDEAEFKRANFQLLKQRPTRILGIMVLPVVISWAIFYALSENLEGPLFWIFLAIPVITIPYTLLRQVKKAYQSQIAPEMPTTFRFGETGLEIKGQTFERNLPWERVHQVVENQEFIFVYEQKAAAMVIPTSGFADEDLERLEPLLQSVSDLEFIKQA